MRRRRGQTGTVAVMALAAAAGIVAGVDSDVGRAVTHVAEIMIGVALLIVVIGWLCRAAGRGSD